MTTKDFLGLPDPAMRDLLRASGMTAELSVATEAYRAVLASLDERSWRNVGLQDTFAQSAATASFFKDPLGINGMLGSSALGASAAVSVALRDKALAMSAAIGPSAEMMALQNDALAMSVALRPSAAMLAMNAAIGPPAAMMAWRDEAAPRPSAAMLVMNDESGPSAAMMALAKDAQTTRELLGAVGTTRMDREAAGTRDAFRAALDMQHFRDARIDESSPGCFSRGVDFPPPPTRRSVGARATPLNVHIVSHAACVLCDDPLVSTQTVESTSDGTEVAVDVEVKVVPICPNCQREAKADPDYFHRRLHAIANPPPQVRSLHGGGETDGVPRGCLRLVRDDEGDLKRDEDE